MESKICKICGKEFLAKTKRKKFCSYECVYQNLLLEKKQYIKKCPMCGKEFNGLKNQTYCSMACVSKIGNNKKTQNHINEIDKPKVCQHCGKEFYSVQKKTKFCSTDCWHNSKRTLIGSIKKCVICGKEFEPKYKNQKCCDTKCAIKERAQTQTIHIYMCKYCGKIFQPKKREKRIYCSRECAFKARGYDLKENISGHDSGWKLGCSSNRCEKRAKKFGVKTENIKPIEIFNRDNWVCGICHKKVDQNLRWPHPLSATLDHVIPLSKGGNHVRDNVQLAHMKCNMKKSNKLERSVLDG
jgi:hypothetical protein